MAWELSMVGAAIVGFTVVVRNCTGAAKDLLDLGTPPKSPTERQVDSDSDRLALANRADEFAKARRRHQRRMWQTVSGSALSLIAAFFLFSAERIADVKRESAEIAQRVAEDKLKKVQQQPPIEPKRDTSVMVQGNLPDEMRLVPDEKYVVALRAAYAEFQRLQRKKSPVLDANDLKLIRAASANVEAALGLTPKR